MGDTTAPPRTFRDCLVDPFGVPSARLLPPALMKLILRSIALAAVVAFPAAAQQTEGTPPVPVFDKTESMVAMRDGVKLHTNIFVPHGFAGNLPIMFVRTPYGIAGADPGRIGGYAELA